MKNKHFGAGFTVVVLMAGMLAGCVSDGGPAAITSAKPGRSVYNCGADGRLSVRRLAGAVEVVSPSGLEVSLPASPPGQSARFGEPPYALLFDDREILWFVTGERPVSCRR